MINLQVKKISEAMTFDKKDMFQRLTKLLEEQGELAEAILEHDIDNTIEESVDNLLVIASISYLIDNDSMVLLEEILNQSFEKSMQIKLPESDNAKFTSVLCDSVIYNVTIGVMSDMIQKYLKVGASKYKGTVTKEEVLDSIQNAVKALVNLMTFSFVENNIPNDTEIVNDLILRKNEKWLEKSIEGNK